MKGMKVVSAMPAKMRVKSSVGGKLQGLGANHSVRAVGGRPTRKGR